MGLLPTLTAALTAPSSLNPLQYGEMWKRDNTQYGFCEQAASRMQGHLLLSRMRWAPIFNGHRDFTLFLENLGAIVI